MRPRLYRRDRAADWSSVIDAHGISRFDGLHQGGEPLNGLGAFSSEDGLLSALHAAVVQPCLELAFERGELLDSGTRLVRTDRGVQLEIQTSAGDVQTFWVWQPDVEALTTVDGMRRNLLEQLENWLPESRLRWGENVRLTAPEDWA